jgi:uncharacterized Rossmann fold enzyme
MGTRFPVMGGYCDGDRIVVVGNPLGGAIESG